MFQLTSERNSAMNELTRFTETASLSSGSISPLTACKVHQTQLAYIHLIFVLEVKMTLLNKLEFFMT